AGGHGPKKLVRWPPALLPYLRGEATVCLREHSGDRVVFETNHRFGDGEGQVAVVDDLGRPLAVDKEGDLQCTFSERGRATVDALMDAIEEVLGLIRDEAGLAGFLAFGALLGAVRGGHLIGHDSDADVGYLSAHRSPADVARESFQLQRIIERAGWETWRFSSADFKVIVPDPEGGRAIDIFGGFVVGDTFYLMPTVHAPYRESMILPIGEVELEGRKIPAPADPEALLAATYGPGWTVPNPSFKFTPPAWLVRKLDGWTRGAIANRGYWWPFYGSRSAKAVPTEPSPFARWVHEREPDNARMVDIGCGTGRDGLWFARQGRQVLGLDYVPEATRNAGATASEEGIPAEFQTFNLYDLRQVLATGAHLAHRDASPTLYGRFLVHALEDVGRHNLWLLASMCLRRGGRMYLEFRTGFDAGKQHEFGEHFRKYLNPDIVVEEIEARGGRIESREEGHGMAVYKHEDPHVCRMVATWQR
ncbi:MAG: class I SAM-dependent methyltransferase, partial [Sciscionella sp.]